ncbi:MAG: hypothetical protein ABIE42_01445 [Candidatus Eisenbacteria bacterium]
MKSKVRTIEEYSEKLDRLLRSRKLRIETGLSSRLPDEPGIYRISEHGSRWTRSIYVGQGADLRRRVWRNHVAGSRRVSTLKRKLINAGQFEDEEAVRRYLERSCVVQAMVVNDEAFRDGLEHFAIAVLRPRWND